MSAIPYPSYTPPLDVLTAQYFSYLPISYVTFNAICFALGVVTSCLWCDSVRRYWRFVQACMFLDRHKPVEIDDFAAYAADFKSLHRVHVSRVLGLAHKSHTQELPVISATNKILTPTIRAQWDIPAVPSSQPVEPPILRLTFDAVVTAADREASCHVFTHVPLEKIKAFLRATSEEFDRPRSVVPSQPFKAAWSWLRNLIGKVAAWNSLRIAARSFEDSRHDSLLDAPIRLELASTPPTDTLASLAYWHLASDAICQTMKVAPTGGEPVGQEARFLSPISDPERIREWEVELVLLMNAQGHSQASQLVLCNGRQSNGYYLYTRELFLIKDPPSLLTQAPIYGLSDSHERDCLVCMSSPKTSILLPCRHAVACRDCLSGLYQERCVLCRAYFQGWIEFKWASEEAPV